MPLSRRQAQLALDVALLGLLLVVMKSVFTALSGFQMFESHSANCDCYGLPAFAAEPSGDGSRLRRGPVDGLPLTGLSPLVGPCDDVTATPTSYPLSHEELTSEFPWFGPRMRAQRLAVCATSSGRAGSAASSSSSGKSFPRRQARKFIVIVTDGFKEEHAVEVLKSYSEHSRAFAVTVPGAKWSFSIYTSYYTGQRNSNFLDRPLTSTDNFFDALRRAGHRTWWIGPFIPIMQLYFPTSDLKTPGVYFDRFNDTDRIETRHSPGDPFAYEHGWNDFEVCTVANWTLDRQLGWPRAHAGLFGGLNTTEERKTRLYRWLDEMKERDSSMFAYTAILDAWQHDGDILERCGWERLIPRLSDDLALFRDWIDANPDYVLILQSDHGQNRRTPEFTLHGESGNGNDGIFVAYSPHLFPASQPDIGTKPLPKMLTSDVGASLSMLIEGIDLPLTSVGVPRVSLRAPTTSVPGELGGVAGDVADAMIVARTVMQLARSARVRGVGDDVVPGAIDLLSRLFPSTLQEGSVDERALTDASADSAWLQSLHQVAEALRAELLESEASANFMIIPVMCVVIVIALLVFGGAFAVSWQSRRGRGVASIGIWRSVGLVTAGLFGVTQLFFTWSKWHELIVQGIPDFIALATACLLTYALLQESSFPSPHSKITTPGALVFTIVLLAFLSLFIFKHLPTTPLDGVLGLFLTAVVLWSFRRLFLTRWLPFACALLFGELVALTRGISVTWFASAIPFIGGVQIFAVAALASHVWGIVRAFSSKSYRATTAVAHSTLPTVHPVVFAMLVHTWSLYYGKLSARLVILSGIYAMLLARKMLGQMVAQVSASYIFGALACAVALLFGGAISRPDMNVQADFASWGVTGNDKHIPLNALNMLLSKFGIVLAMMVQLHMDLNRAPLGDSIATTASQRSISWRTLVSLEYFGSRALPLQLLVHSAAATIALRVIQISLSQAHRPEEAFSTALMAGIVGIIQQLVSIRGDLSASPSSRSHGEL